MRDFVRRVLWRGGIVERISAIATAAVALIALAAAVLGSVNVVDVSGDAAQSLGLFGLAAVLVWLLSEAHRREEQQAMHDTMILRAQKLADLVEGSLPGVRQIASDEIAAVLDEALSRSANWSFRGGSGRWLRDASLPRMAEIRERAPTVYVQLLDPRSEHLCREYARYRAGQRSADDVRADEGDPRTIQTDILASIAALYWHAKSSRIQAHAVLLQVFSPLRFDIADEALVVTVANKNDPGLLALRDSWFYNSILDEIHEAHRAGTAVVQGEPPAAFRPNSPTPQWVREALGGLTVAFPGVAATPLLDGYAAADNLNFARIAERVLSSSD